MKLCPHCGMTVEQAETCPYCKTELSQKDEKAFRKDYTTDLLKMIWFSALSFVAGAVSLLVFGEVHGGIGVHTLSFAALSLLFAILQFRAFGKYSRRFHTSTFWRVTAIVLKYVCGSVALMLAAVPIVMLFA